MIRAGPFGEGRFGAQVGQVRNHASSLANYGAHATSREGLGCVTGDAPKVKDNLDGIAAEPILA